MSRRTIAAGTATLLAAAGLTIVVQAATMAPAAAATCSVLFDDFQYSSPADPALSARHWTVRTGGGGPGIPGTSWLSSNITFPVSDGQKVMQLSSYTDGTGTGTAQTEIYHQRKFFEGTYASRVRFTDAPVSGNDGDRVVQTFFTITPLAYPMEPNYGEIDFEYLPNGGWGETGSAFFETTWETYQPDPWVADNIHAVQRLSYNGWHDLVAQVANGRVKYFIDDVLVADHGDKYYPETPMSINYNLWFIDSITHSGGRSTYIQQVDWLYFAGNEVISTTTARNRVNAYRGAATTYVDSVGTPGTCQEPGNPAPPTPSGPDLPAGFIRCAGENGQCSFTGTRVVAYGAGTYTYKTATDGTACTNAAFNGDPAANLVKSCYVAPLGGPSGYTQCAAENGTCSFTGNRNVAYGANGAFSHRLASGSTACTNAVFGDPLNGTAKACYLPPAGGPAGSWTQCAAENGTCSTASGQPVAYGAYGAFNYLTASGNVSCTNATFGDPIADTVKACYTRTGGPNGYAITCAAEHGTCTFSGPQTVAFGARGKYVFRSFTGNAACTPAAFGNDPLFGVAKACYLTQ